MENNLGSDHEPIRIRNLIELKKLIERLSPSADDTAPKPIVIDTVKEGIADDTYSGMVTIPQKGGQSTLRRTLLDGFEMLKSTQEIHQKSLATQNMGEEYGWFLPPIAPNPSDHYTWVDAFINRNMGGRREGLSIVWDLPEGKFKLNPWTCELTKINAS